MISKISNTKILILCGGRGKRMGKFTKNIPKPLIKVGKTPIIQHKIYYYKKQGFKNFTFCVGYKANILKKFLNKKYKKVTFSNAGIKSGILKRIYLVRKEVNDITFISYGDTLAKINLSDLYFVRNKDYNYF